MSQHSGKNWAEETTPPSNRDEAREATEQARIEAAAREAAGKRDKLSNRE